LTLRGPKPARTFTAIVAPANTPDIKLEHDGKDMPEFHPILTTD
jgi:hypothetical protein